MMPIYGDEDELEREREEAREDYDDYCADMCSHGGFSEMYD